MTTGQVTPQSGPRELQFVGLTKAKLTENALSYDAEPTMDEWREHGRVLQQCSGAALWWIGDWFVYGEQKFGEMAYQAVGDYEPETVRCSVWVSSRVTLRNRRTELGWAHHRAVAALESGHQQRWLDTAVRHKLTERELVASIKAGRIVRKDDSKRMKMLSPALTDIQFVFASPEWKRWKNQQWEHRNELTVEQRRAWLKVLQEPAEMAATLAQELGVE